MRHDFMQTLAAMTTLLTAVAIAAPIAAENVYPECPLRRSAEVSFRAPGSHDVLEISIGAGSCYKATLTLVIREGRGGEILYSYVQRFKQHTVVGWDKPDLNEVAAEVVDRMISEPMRSTSSLPPYAEPEAYYEEYYNHIEVSRDEYERLRNEDRPMFQHLTYYEGWQYAIRDEATKSSKVIITGGL